MEFKLIKKLGLKIDGDDHPENHSQTVNAEDLEKLLAFTREVTGSISEITNKFAWDEREKLGDTHKAKLILIEELKPVAEENNIQGFELASPMKIELNESQISELKSFYESQTGKLASEIGKCSHESVKLTGYSDRFVYGKCNGCDLKLKREAQEWQMEVKE